jgi:hypothetical protein
MRGWHCNASAPKRSVAIMIPGRRRAGRRGQGHSNWRKGRRAELPDARPPQAPLQPFIRCTCDFRQVATQRIVASGFQ